MPIINDPSRQIGIMIPFIQNQIAKDRMEGTYDGISNEVVAAVNPDGSYTVRGQQLQLTTTGVSSAIEVGDIVKVGWRGGIAMAILAHTARRIKPGPPPPASGPIVEMLLAAPTAQPISAAHWFDSLDVYFRNANQLTLLDCRDKITKAGFTIAVASLQLVPNSWGLDKRHFLVSFTNQTNSHPCIAIFSLSGGSTTPITSTAVTRLVQVIDLATLNIALGTISWTQNVLGGGNVSTPISLGTALATGYSIFLPTDPFHSIIQTAFATIFNAVYTRNGHLILSVNLSIGNTTAGGPFNVNGGWNYPFIVDATAGTVLFNGINNQGLWPTSIYNGAAFVQVGPGFYDETGTGTNAWQGGAQMYMVPDSTGNYLRVFIGVRAFYTGGNLSLGGKTQQYVEAQDTVTGVRNTLFPLTTYASGERSHLTLLSADQRYVMWMRASPGSLASPNAFQLPTSTTLAGYNFEEGIHISDLGIGKLAASIDYIPLTSLSNIETFLNDVPILTSAVLMWEDHNDLRTPVDSQTSVTSGRVLPEFVIFRTSSAGKPVVTVPFALPLKRFGIPQNVATLLAIPIGKRYITDFINFLYLNSGHADMVQGYPTSPNSPFVCVQVINGPGVAVPSR